MTRPHRRLFGMAQPKVPADLLRAPPLRQQISRQFAELEVGVEAPAMSTCPASGRLAVRVERTITPACVGVAAQLTRDRAVRVLRFLLKVAEPQSKPTVVWYDERASRDRDAGARLAFMKLAGPCTIVSVRAVTAISVLHSWHGYGGAS
ncbi:hypothetical protein [Kribbella sp. NPDC055071]